MSDPNHIRELIESAVAEALARSMPAVRQQICDQVAAAIGPALAAAAASGGSTERLNAAAASISESATQVEILKALLDGAGSFAPRAALFVVRGQAATVWQSRGFRDESALKNVSVDVGKGLAARAVADRMPVSAAATEFDAALVSAQGNPDGGNATVLPLVVKDKVAAILYVDAGMSSAAKFDGAAVQVLVRTASQWLELIALRKTSPAQESMSAAAPVVAAPLAASTAPPVPVAAAASASLPSMAPAATAQVSPPAAAASPGAGEGDLAHLPAEEQEVHKKARRFAKLLVDEIKLYNPAKVAEGKQNKDLYQRLKDDIDKSRATYDKRFGGGPAAGARYFDSEIVRILADGDVSIFGGGYPQ